MTRFCPKCRHPSLDLAHEDRTRAGRVEVWRCRECGAEESRPTIVTTIVMLVMGGVFLAAPFTARMSGGEGARAVMTLFLLGMGLGCIGWPLARRRLFATKATLAEPGATEPLPLVSGEAWARSSARTGIGAISAAIVLFAVVMFVRERRDQAALDEAEVAFDVARSAAVDHFAPLATLVGAPAPASPCAGPRVSLALASVARVPRGSKGDASPAFVESPVFRLLHKTSTPGRSVTALAAAEAELTAALTVTHVGLVRLSGDAKKAGLSGTIDVVDLAAAKLVCTVPFESGGPGVAVWVKSGDPVGDDGARQRALGEASERAYFEGVEAAVRAAGFAGVARAP